MLHTDFQKDLRTQAGHASPNLGVLLGRGTSRAVGNLEPPILPNLP